MTFSIRQKIIFFTVIPVILIYNLIIIVSLYQNIGSETRYIENRLVDAVVSNTFRLDSVIHDAVLLAESSAKVLGRFSNFDDGERLKVSRALLSTSNQLGAVGVVSEDEDSVFRLGFVWRESRIWAYSDKNSMPGISTWLQTWLQGEETGDWSPLLDLRGDGKNVGFIYASRFTMEKGSQGASLVYLPLSVIKNQWVVPRGINPRLFLVNRNLDNIFYSNTLDLPRTQLTTEFMLVFVRNVMKKMSLAGQMLTETRFAGQDVLVFQQDIPSVGWTLLGAVPRDEVMKVVRSKVLVQALMMVLSLAAVFISVWFVAGRIVRPLRKLDRAMARVSSGDLNTDIDVSGKDEAGMLALRFSDMTRQLALREKMEREARTTSFDHIVQALSGEYFYFSHDHEGNIHYVSPSIDRIMGISAENFCSHYTRYYTDAPQNKKAMSATEQVLRGASSCVYEAEMFKGDGSISYIEIVKVPVYDYDGHVSGIEGMARDITRRISDTARFRGLLESAPDAMVITNADGLITMVNARTEALLGYMRSALIGQSVSLLFPDDDRFPLMNMSREERARLKISSGIELSARKIDGKNIPVELTLNPIETPEQILISIFIRDISDRHAAQQALRTSEERFRRMIEALQQEYIFYTQRVDGSYVYITDSVEKILGYSRETVMAKEVDFISTKEGRAQRERVFELVGQGKIQPSYELEIVKADGTPGVMEVLDTPAFDESGQVTVIEGLVRDRTRERNAATALAEARDAAEAANQAKSQFLSNMSHELRTPLNGVLGYAQLLLSGRDTTPQQYDQLIAIQTCGQHLLTLINDILDLTKAESGALELLCEPVNVAVLVDTVEQILYQKAETKGLVLNCNVQAGAPLEVLGDETKIRQILINLVGNAIKYTETGSVSLTATRDDDRLVFDVVDTGIGMSQQQLDYVFEPFRQADGGFREGGTGLGLSISRRLASAMKGSLEAFSAPGGGSRFVFSMPMQLVSPDSAIAGGSSGATVVRGNLDPGYGRLAPGQHKRVLVVDDISTNRDILQQMLKVAGFDVVSLDSGRGAVDTVRKEKFDLILMDLRMPDLSGFRATRMIQTRLKERCPPVIAISAGVSSSVLDDLKRWGFVGFIGKPVRTGELFRVIRHHLQLEWEEGQPRNEQKEIAVLQAMTEKQATDFVALFSEAVDMGDIEAIQQIARGLNDDDAVTAAWAGRILEHCEALALEDIERLIEQLSVKN